MRKVRVGWDHYCSGVWELDSDDDVWTAIEPEDLPISNRLRRSIRRWATEQTLAYNGGEPVSEERRVAWRTRATRLTERLREELVGDFQVAHPL